MDDADPFSQIFLCRYPDAGETEEEELGEEQKFVTARQSIIDEEGVSVHVAATVRGRNAICR